jgi:GNAT superfamily N-acetyltransferase
VRRLRKALAVLLRQGPRSFAIRALSGLGIYRLLLLAWVDKPPVMEARVPLEIGVLEEDEVEELIEAIPAVPESEVRKRLAGKDNTCFIGRRQGRLVHATWAVTTRTWSPFLGCDLELEPDEALVCDAYTVPEARGAGVSSAVGSWLGRYLYERHPSRSNYRRVVSAFFPEDRAALKMIEAAGFHPYRWQGFVRLGPWRRDFSRPVKGRA